MVGEHHATKGAGADAGEFDDPDARKRSCHCRLSFEFHLPHPFTAVQPLCHIRFLRRPGRLPREPASMLDRRQFAATAFAFAGLALQSRVARAGMMARSKEHTSELQSLMRISYAVFCLQKKTTIKHNNKP